MENFGCDGHVVDAFVVQPFGKIVQRQVEMGVVVKNAANLWSVFRVDLHHAATIDTNISVSVWSQPNEPPLLNPTCKPFPHVKRLLLGKEGCHVRKRAPHHAPGWGVLGRLRDGDERHAVVGFDPLQFDVIEEVASRSIHFVKKDAIQFGGVLLRVGDQFVEGLALVRFAGGFRDLEESDKLAAFPFCVPAQGVFLNSKRESFSLLLAAAETRANPMNRFTTYPRIKRRTTARRS